MLCFLFDIDVNDWFNLVRWIIMCELDVCEVDVVVMVEMEKDKDKMGYWVVDIFLFWDVDKLVFELGSNIMELCVMIVIIFLVDIFFGLFFLILGLEEEEEVGDFCFLVLVEFLMFRVRVLRFVIVFIVNFKGCVIILLLFLGICEIEDVKFLV